MPKENPTPLLEGLEAISSGACPGCAECGLEDGDGDTDALDIANEGHFSWSSCDACGSSLGGQRHPAHGLNPDTNTVLHLNVCADCYCGIANGFDNG